MANSEQVGGKKKKKKKYRKKKKKRQEYTVGPILQLEEMKQYL